MLSDALESIVNVVAAAFEGGLIAFAAILIIYKAIQAFVLGPELRALDLGLALVLAAGVVNALLGLYLVRTGRRSSSLTLVADGKHVLSDWWTSAGIVVGLLLVRVTGLEWIDPLVACLVALQLFWTGFHLVREAARGLLDEEDPEPARTARAAARTNWWPSPARAAASVLPAAAGAWLTRPCISPTRSCPRSRSVSGCSPSPTASATCSPMTPSCAARSGASSCARCLAG